MEYKMLYVIKGDINTYLYIHYSGMQCRTGIKGPGRELFDGGPSLNNIKLHILHIDIGKYTSHIIIYKI